MSKLKKPFCISAILFLAYYLMAPIFWASLSMPFWGSLLGQFNLCCLGLAVVLLFKKGGLATAVFALLATVLQGLPIWQYAVALFGGFNLSYLLNLVIAIFQFFSFASIAYLAFLTAKGNRRSVKKIWFAPTVLATLSVTLFAADQTYLFLVSQKVHMTLLYQNALSFVTLSAAIALLGFWYKKN